MNERILFLLAVSALACGGSGSGAEDASPDADVDSDSDADADSDSDADTDTCPDLDYEVTDLDANGSTTCYLLAGGGVKCWGGGAYDGYWESCTGDTPADCPLIDIGAEVTQVATGGSHSCALTDEGGVVCWGWDGGGMYECENILGYGEGYDCGACEIPADWGPLPLVGVAKQISAYSVHNAAVLADGNVRTWGCARNPTITPAGDWPENDYIDFGGGAVQVTSGSHFHCALTQGGDVYCWGVNEYGQLGYGHTDYVAASRIPDEAGPVVLGGAAVQISSGGNHTCVVLEEGEVLCWGVNDYGQLGYGNTEFVGDNEFPMEVGAVSLGGPATQVTAGSFNTCVVREGGAALCWGAGGDIPLGYRNNDVIGDDEIPASTGTIDTGGSVERMEAGYSQICALLDNGLVRCWGKGDSGQLGYGSNEDIGDDEVPGDVCEVPVM